ncbi:MAG: J domain-containing protein [Candidatus Cloacimonetes bacterium]|nr:J domain-containing protein [Candidatus Cloacimonadota bacterium]
MNYYQILGISFDASHQEIKAAWQKKVRVLHPDVNKQASAQKDFLAVQEAYTVLSDPSHRLVYNFSLSQNSYFSIFRGKLPPKLKSFYYIHGENLTQSHFLSLKQYQEKIHLEMEPIPPEEIEELFLGESPDSFEQLQEILKANYKRPPLKGLKLLEQQRVHSEWVMNSVLDLGKDYQTAFQNAKLLLGDIPEWKQSWLYAHTLMFKEINLVVHPHDSWEELVLLHKWLLSAFGVRSGSLSVSLSPARLDILLFVHTSLAQGESIPSLYSQVKSLLSPMEYKKLVMALANQRR